MNYALVENGIVTNIIWLYPDGEAIFPNAVPMNDYPVGIGDAYDGEYFYRDGERILSNAEQMAAMQAELEAAKADLADADAALAELSVEWGEENG